MVAPGAGPGQIRLRVEGASRTIDGATGDPVIELPGDEQVRGQRPVMYQQNTPGNMQRDEAQFAVNQDGTVELRIGGYDPTRELVIDPVLRYSTHLGVSAFTAAIAIDPEGNSFVTGVTESLQFPTTAGAFQTAFSQHRLLHCICDEAES